ncbi:MAG: GNAT family N-acetyltransferase [Candidatus Krumholzibacteriia bacterium]
MTSVDAASGLEVRVGTAPPAGWSDLLAAAGPAEFTADAAWTALAAAHYPAAAGLWITAGRAGTPLGGLAVLQRRRRGLRRLESSLDGTLGGPQVRGDLAPDERRAVVRTLGRALAGRLRGTTGLAAMALAGTHREETAGILAADGWRRDDYETAVVDCREGLDHVGERLWTNNRRNERNRGLKRGCTLHGEPDPEALAAWYPLYAARAAAWAQAPVPLAFLTALVESRPDRLVFDHVRLGGEVVGGHLGFVSGGRLVAWQGAVRPDLARTHFLTTLLYWRDIMTACERGLAAVDFGGCVGRDSLWDFKRRCGAEPEPRTQLVRRTAFGRAHGLLASALRRPKGGRS